MSVIFPLLENKSPENQPFLECASELLYTQLDASRSFLFQDYKKNIVDIFKGNVKINFFGFYMNFYRISLKATSKHLSTGAVLLIGS